jgi:hypothetical protein
MCSLGGESLVVKKPGSRRYSLRGEMSDINEEKRKYLEELRAIVPSRSLESLEQVRDPATVNWCIAQLEQGKSMDEIRHMVALTGEKKRWLWRRLKAILIAYENPKDELSAMTEYYLQQQERLEQLESDIEDLSKRIAAGPNDRVAKDSKGQSYVVEDKGFNSLIDYRIKARKILLDETERHYKAFLDQKKSKDGGGKYQGATIHIHSNVPRPKLKDVDEVLGDEDDK